MLGRIVHTQQGVTLIGGVATDSDTLDLALSLAPILVAADGGADNALKLCQKPVAVIGDLDSLGAEARQELPAEIIHRIAEQETTDFEKCLQHVSAPLILAVGVTGGRMDHQSAVFSTLVRMPQTRCILIGEKDICFHCPPELHLPARPGDRVSLFPMAPCRGQSTGLRWPIDGIDFAPDGRIGTSNQATGETVTIRMAGAGMLVMLPREQLAGTIRALEWEAGCD